MNSQKQSPNPYKDIVAIVCGFSLIGILTSQNAILYGALGVGFLSILSEVLAGYIAKGWRAFSKALGYINSRILLSLLYLFVMVPFALMYRLAKKKGKPLPAWIKVEKPGTDFSKPW